jgi:60 kDa SS-A/Ro ribonucleoprotein
MKYNTTAAGRSTRTTNLAGGEAFQQTPKMEFASLVLTTLMKDQFYRTEAQIVAKIRELMTKVSPEFAAQTAVYARRVHGMRSVTHFIAAEIAKNVKAKPWTRKFFNAVVRRPDDILEILSCYIALYKKPIPNSLRRGLGDAISRLNDYELAKYRKSAASLSMVDAVNLVHPKSTESITKLMKGTLAPAETWETKMTTAGQKGETEDETAGLKADAWRELLKSGKIGYMAIIRNIRNILEQAPDMVDRLCELITDPERVKNSLMFPYRFLSAIDIVTAGNFAGAQKVLRALNAAVDISLANVPKFPGSTLVVLDTSGSMTTGMVGSKSAAEVGSLFAATLVKALDADFMSFSDNAHYQTLNSADSTLSVAKSIKFISGGTNFHAIFQEANKAYDRVIILSDMQGWVGHNAPTASFAAYCKRLGANPLVYSFDLCGMGTMQFPQNRVFALAGFSDKVFSIMEQLETNRNAMIEEIEATTWEIPQRNNPSPKSE